MTALTFAALVTVLFIFGACLVVLRTVQARVERIEDQRTDEAVAYFQRIRDMA